jgi:hypothetical protein
VLVVAIPWLSALACGGRTGDLLPSDALPSRGSGDQGSGAETSAGGHTSASTGPATGPGSSVGPGTGTVPARGSGGRAVGGGIPSAGTGGVPSFGFAGAGGNFDGQCSYPECNCTDCYSQCACKYGPTTNCMLECFSGAGGSVAAGGSTAILDGGNGFHQGPTTCISPLGVGQYCPATNLPVNTCCTNAFQCGVELLSSPGIANIPFASGCLVANDPGYDYPGCPDFDQLLNLAPGSTDVAACCRPDGTCGLGLDILGAGCVQSLSNGKPLYCPIADAGALRDSGASTVPPAPHDAGRD